MDKSESIILQVFLNSQGMVIPRLVRKLRQRRRKILRVLIKIINDTTLLQLMQQITYPGRDRPQRAIWMKPRSNDFWERIVPTFQAEDWNERFRMNYPTFTYICEMLREYLEPEQTFLVPRPPISVEKQVAITLFYLASCCEYRTVGDIFGAHKTSVWRCVHKVVEAINRKLMPLWIRMPTEPECTMIAAAFEEKTHIPQLIGCIDGSHIPVRPPSNGYRDYVNRKGWTSVILQAVVDNTYRFRNINCTTPGSSHDARVFRRSGLFEHSEHLIPNTKKEINGSPIPYMIVGDPAYPLLPWLLKGYTRTRPLTPEEDSFNVHLNSARVSVEIAFGRLKARWRTVQKRIDLRHTFAPDVIAACCTLHNIVEASGEPFTALWMTEVREAQRRYQPPQDVDVDEMCPEAVAARDLLKDYLTQFPLRRSYMRR